MDDYRSELQWSTVQVWLLWKVRCSNIGWRHLLTKAFGPTPCWQICRKLLRYQQFPPVFIGRDPSCEMVRSSSTLTNAGIEIIKTSISETLTCGLVSPLLRSLTVLKISWYQLVQWKWFGGSWKLVMKFANVVRARFLKLNAEGIQLVHGFDQVLVLKSREVPKPKKGQRTAA